MSVTEGAPTGTVTFLFTDVVGSTRLWDVHPAEMREALELHDDILRSAIADHAGHVFSTAGDSFGAAFARASDGLSAALSAQRQLGSVQWPPLVSLGVRMGLHTGEAQERNGYYYGSSVNRAARVMGLGDGAHVLLSSVTAELLAHDVELVDLGSYWLKGLGDAERIAAVAVEGVTSTVAPLGSSVGHIPQRREDLIGRTQELAEVREALRISRLVTICGVGGVGKTRLAMEVAHSLVDEYRDGVWFCELGPIGDPAAAPDAVASTLDLRLVGEVTWHEVAAAIADRHLLLVLDNCEHVLDVAADGCELLLDHCENLGVLATSRGGLGLFDERILTLQPLEQSAACTLFVDRAAMLGARVSEDETVLSICSRLDHLPLAIELAAARCRAMAPIDILGGLDDRFTLLSGGRRRRVSRQQTLRAMVDWSYELLEEDERTLLEQLSVFSGGFTSHAALTVARSRMSVLESLVDRSLVTVRNGPDGARYGMLETIRQYASERLAASGLTDHVKDRHADYFVDFVIEAAPGFTADQQVIWTRRTDAELDNLRAAAQWTMSADPDPTRLATIAGELFWYSFIRAQWEVLTWLLKGLERWPDWAWQRLHLAAGSLRLWAMGDYERGVALAERACAMPITDPRDAAAENIRGSNLIWAGRTEEGLAAFEKGERLAEELGDAFSGALAAGRLMLAHTFAGRSDVARQLLGAARQRAQAAGNPSARAFFELAAGYAKMEADPIEHFETAESIAGQCGDRLEHMMALRMLGVANPAADLEHRAGWLETALTINRESGDVANQWITMRYAAVVLAEAGNHEAAATVLGAVEASQQARPRTALDRLIVGDLDHSLEGVLGAPRCRALLDRASTLTAAEALRLTSKALAAVASNDDAPELDLADR